MNQKRKSDALLIAQAAAHIDPVHFDGLVSNLSKQLGAAKSPYSSALTAETSNSLKEVSELLVKKEAEYLQRKSLLESLKAMDQGDLRKALPVAYPDTELNNLLAKLDAAEQRLIAFQVKYKPEHPMYKNLQATVDDLQRKIDDRIEGIMLGLKAKLDAIGASVDTIKAKLQDRQNPNQRGP